MAFLTYALPILPGQADRAGSFVEELTPELREEYERLNREGALKRHLEWVQPTPWGDLLIVLFETDDPARLNRAFTDTPYDRWWRARVKDIHGFDPGDPDFHPAMPRLTHNWTNDL